MARNWFQHEQQGIYLASWWCTCTRIRLLGLNQMARQKLACAVCASNAPWSAGAYATTALIDDEARLLTHCCRHTFWIYVDFDVVIAEHSLRLLLSPFTTLSPTIPSAVKEAGLHIRKAKLLKMTGTTETPNAPPAAAAPAVADVLEERLIDAEYKIWKKNTPYL